MLPLITHSNLDDILHFVAKGAMSHGENLEMWEHLKKIAHEHQAKRILIECAATAGRISMEHCFDLIEKIPILSRMLACKIALVETQMGEEARELLKFVETAATDRGAHFKLFFDREEAKIWLK